MAPGASEDPSRSIYPYTNHPGAGGTTKKVIYINLSAGFKFNLRKLSVLRCDVRKDVKIPEEVVNPLSYGINTLYQ